MTIQFGTDGWRAVVGEDFTPDNVAQVIQAFADLYPGLPEAGKPVMVGYDRRNQSPETAQLVAEVLVGNGIPTSLANDYCPTPCVSWMVHSTGGAAGIMVTASHNPPAWNGIKFKESYGGAAAPAYTDPIEAQIARNAREGKHPKRGDARQAQSFHPHDAYIAGIKDLVDLDVIRAAQPRVLYDAMYGAGAGYLNQLLPEITELHGERDINFGGIHPEPIRPYVDEAIRIMQRGHHDICVVTDGDADRIGAIDEAGHYVTSHEIFALLLNHVLTHKQWSGNVVKSITTTRMIDRICAQHGMTLQVTKVGFKYISPALNAPNMLVGGEESGGIGFPKHVCERDGVLCALLLLEMCAVQGKKLGQLVAELQETWGPCHYRRIDLHLTPEQMTVAKEQLANKAARELCGQPVVKLDRIDGFHFLRADDSWLLLRASGTEPLFRTYAEAKSMNDVEALLQSAQQLVGV